MNYLKKFMARTVYNMQSDQNKMIFKLRCGNTRQTARKNPEVFEDRATGIVALLLAIAKYWGVLILKKLVYIGIFLYIPYVLMSWLVGSFAYESTMSYLFIVMNVLFGSVVNPWLYRLDFYEKRMLAICDERWYFYNRLVMKACSNAIAMALALRIFQVGFWQYGLWISIAAALMRPLGELIAYAIRQKTILGERGHNSFVGICMALAVIIAYVLPVVNKSIGAGSNFFYGMPFAIICIVCFAVSLFGYILIDFKAVTKMIMKNK